TPPLVPASTGLPLVIERGAVRLRAPISVAQVSAFTAAMTPIYASSHPLSGHTAYAAHSSSPTPPLAHTWPASSLPVFSYFASAASFARCFRFHFDNSVEEMKKAISTPNQTGAPIGTNPVQSTTADLAPDTHN